MFALLAPGAVIVVAVMMGRRALAGEEAARTMSLLLANPISRGRIVRDKAIAITMIVALMCAAIFGGTALGNGVSQLGMSYAKIAGLCVHLFALGVFFGMGALVAGAASGSLRITTYVGAGLPLASWALNTFLPANENFASWAKLSPFYYYQRSMPINNGMALGDVCVLLGAALVLVALSIWLFSRRDVRG